MTAAREAAAPPGDDWYPAGEEPLPVGSIAHYTVLRSNGVSVLSLPTGEIDAASEPSTGMYFRDTRYLSRLSVSFGGVAPILLDARETEQGLTAIFTNPALRTPAGRTVPGQALVLRRKRVVTEGMLESLTVSNYGKEAVDLDLRLAIDADFRDIFEVRGYERHTPVPPVTSEAEGKAIRYRYTGQDGILRITTIAFQQEPVACEPGEATFIVHLEPRETAAIELEVLAERHLPDRTLARASSRLLEGQRAWLSSLTTVETNSHAVTNAVQRALLDIEALRTTTDEEEYVAAGVPWFDTLFGRDSLITGIELLAFTPEVLRTSLIVLARHQATEVDPVHDAAPGKLPHELRWGELANTGEVPFGRYYGSVDVTPLFLIAMYEYVRWTGDYETLRSLWPAVEAALGWCREETKKGVGGFLAYARESSGGLENQGWKDSHDAIVWPDGRMVEQPIALVEVQAYLAAAYNAYAHLAAMMGQGTAVEAWQLARQFSRAFEQHYADEDLGYILCLDGNGKRVPTAASNAGHVLWAGAARRESAGRTAERLMQPDMFSGWGVRTLATSVAGFNPLGYHVGSVWPHDNALFLHGLRWYGFDERAETLAGALIQMALGFPEYRVPELFSGDARELRLVPTPYPVASRPQAWSAASIPYVFTAMLGLRPNQPGRLSVVRPILPLQLEWVRIRNLRVGRGSVDLAFRRTGHGVGVEVENIRGGSEVVLSAEWPDDLPHDRDPRA